AALRNLSVNDQLNDFAHTEPVHILRPFRKLTIDEKAWTDRVRSLSGLFAQYPELRTSSVELSAGEGGYYLVNSEGSEIGVPDGRTYVRVRASAQASDGMTVRGWAMFHALETAKMPSEADMGREIQSLAKNVVALSQAPKGEDYSGPVLFEGMAGAQIL